MFTGIITETGKLKSVRRRGQSLELAVEGPETAAGAGLGDSVAVDGVCLTVTSINGPAMTMDVGEETYRLTTLSKRKVSDIVNLEPSLKLGGKMGGHVVTGHVDAKGRIVSIEKKTTEVTVAVSFPDELARFIAPKGSITVDGISLTVGEVERGRFLLHLIPHTVENTTLRERRAGDEVNLEADVLARYVVNALDGGRAAAGGLFDKLKEYGYTKAEGNV